MFTHAVRVIHHGTVIELVRYPAKQRCKLVLQVTDELITVRGRAHTELANCLLGKPLLPPFLRICALTQQTFVVNTYSP